MRLILHVGTEKAGSTALQRSLHESRNDLRSAGVLVPESLYSGGPWHRSIVAASCPPRLIGDLRQAVGMGELTQHEYRRRLLRSLEDELEAEQQHCDTVVISSEHVHSRLVDDASMTALGEMLRKRFDEIDVVVYLRRQDRFAVSKASTHARGGGISVQDLDGLDLAARAPLVQLDYLRFIQRLAAVTDPSRIHVRPLGPRPGDVSDVVKDFRSHLGSAGVALLRPQGDRNTGLRLSPEGLHLFLLLVADHKRVGRSFPRRDLAKVLHEMEPGTSFKAFVSAQEASTFVDMFEDSNTELAHRLGRDRPLFDANFDEYTGPTQVDHVRMVDVAVRLLGRTE